jgi:DNA-binding NarL/FixJ family response regulator
MSDRSIPEAVADLLDAMPYPAFLLSPADALAYANETARTRGVSLSQWNATERGSSEATVRLRRRPVRMADGAWSIVYLETDADRVPAVANRLAPRLRQLASLVANGRSDKEIALEMGITVASTRTYVRELYRQLAVHSRAELTRMWLLAA